MKPNELTRQIIGAAIEVHRELGPGKTEAAYESALTHELRLRSLPHHSQRPVPVVYKSVKLECGYRLDLLVEDTVVVEVKSVELVNQVHRAQVLTYLRLGGWKLSLLLNFNVAVLKEGIERLVLGLEEPGRQTAETRGTQSMIRPGASEVPRLQTTIDSGDAGAERLVRAVIAGAKEVHQELGPGLLPSAYETCLCHELHLAGVPFDRRRPLPLNYKGHSLADSDEVELLVGGKCVVKSGAWPAVQPVHKAELLSQLRLGGWPVGLLVNFNTIRFTEGLHRLVLRR